MITLALLLLAQAATPGMGDQVYAEHRSLSIPDEIAPAVLPYMQCTMEKMNDEVGAGLATGDAVRAAEQRVRQSCSLERQQAEKNALAMLSGFALPGADQQKLVEDTLSSIDHMQDNVAERLDKNNLPSRPKG